MYTIGTYLIFRRQMLHFKKNQKYGYYVKKLGSILFLTCGFLNTIQSSNLNDLFKVLWYAKYNNLVFYFYLSLHKRTQIVLYNTNVIFETK